MTANIHFLSYIAHFFLEWEIFQKKKTFRDNQNTRVMFDHFFRSKIMPFTG